MASPGKIIGLAVPWCNEGFAQVSGQVEMFHPNAFDGFLRTCPRVEALVEHCKSALIGDTHGGGLVLSPGERGLWFSLDLLDTGGGREAARRVREGELRGVSIAFNSEASELAGIYPHQFRLVTRARLTEISLVERPAYGWTTKFLQWKPAPDLPSPARSSAVFVQRSRPGTVETTRLLPGGPMRGGLPESAADRAAAREALHREMLLSEFELWRARNGG
jgi:HK97 family phage prohead protease